MILLLFSSVFFGLFLLLLFKWFQMKYKYFDTGLHKYRGPLAVPIIGTFWVIAYVNATGFLDFLTKATQKYNDNVTIHIALTPSIITTDYKLIEVIMNGNMQTKKADTYKFLVNWLSTGLLISYGEKWRKRRKIITPAFHFQILEQFVEVFHVASDTLVDELSKEVGDGTKILNIYEPISLCTLDVICETAMGTKMNAQIVKQSKYISSVKSMGEILMKRMCSPIHNFELTYRLTTDYRTEKQCLEILHGYTDTIIKARRKELLDNGNGQSTIMSEELGVKKKCAFLDVLLQSTIDGKPLSNADIREEVDTFMFEGHDTTASAIGFALFMMAKHPEVQTKVLKEQQQIFGNERKRPASYNDLNDMKYLELVIKETLRLYPSVPLMGREVLEDFEYDGMVFKKGMNVGICIYALHRNPKYFAEPETFDPDRFSKENYLGNNPYAYIPFAAGNRNCIGQRFAMFEMKAVISKLIRFFELKAVVPEHKLELVPEAILRCLNGILVQVKRRNNF